MTVLDVSRIQDALTRQSASCLEQIDFFAEIDSTNTFLKDQVPPAPGKIRVAIADHQTAGRGRQQNPWVSAPGESLCLSLAYRFDAAPPELPALTLALGIGLAETLRAAGVAAIQLKWPNDLLINDAKLGGILTESVVRGNRVTVVVGIGLNVELRSVREQVDVSRWALSAGSLADAMPSPPSREALSTMLIDSVVSTLQQYAAAGFAPVASRFAAYDWLFGKELEVDTAEGLVTGHGAGVADDGALRVATTGGERQIIAGSIMRAAP